MWVSSGNIEQGKFVQGLESYLYNISPWDLDILSLIL